MKGVGPMTFNVIVQNFKTISDAYNAPLEHFSKILSPKLFEQYKIHKASFDIEQILIRLEKDSIKVITRENEEYPKSFLQLIDAPICLYCKGDVEILKAQNTIAIVGTRNPSQYGLTQARIFADFISSQDYTIVSGLALGIDVVAHKKALDNHKKTVAFLGSGIDIIYPKENTQTYNQIASEGLIVSEFPPGTINNKGLFVSRNRLVAAFSKYTLVIEGSETSGSLITAHLAAEYGKEVFVLPGPVNLPSFSGCFKLIREGATMVINPKEIIQEKNFTKSNQLIITDESLSIEEKLLLKIFSHNAELTVDEIVNLSSMDTVTTLATLSSLELNSFIVKTNSGKYTLLY